MELHLGGFSAPSESRKYMQQKNKIKSLKKQTKNINCYTFTHLLALTSFRAWPEGFECSAAHSTPLIIQRMITGKETELKWPH